MVGFDAPVNGDDPAGSDVTEHLLFLTGHLAEPRLRRGAGSDGAAAVQLGGTQCRRQGGGADDARRSSAAASGRLGDVTRIVLPGRCKGDLDALGRDLGVPVQLGPEEIKDLPEFFGGKAQAARTDARTTAGSSPRSSRRSALAVGEILAPGRGPATPKAPT